MVPLAPSRCLPSPPLAFDYSFQAQAGDINTNPRHLRAGPAQSQRAKTTAPRMISLKASRYVLVACAVLAFMLLFTTGPDRSVSRWSLPKTSLTPSTPDAKFPPPNYRSTSFNRQQQDTTSELGRASNATLGVRDIHSSSPSWLPG